MSRASTMLLYGASGSTKTTQIGFAAEYEYERSGLKTRLLSADSTWDPIEPKIAKGIVDVFHVQRLAGLPNQGAIACLHLISEGYWPVEHGGKLLMAPPETNGLDKIGMIAVEGLGTLGDFILRDHIAKQRQIGQDLVGKFQDSATDSSGKSISRTFAKAAPSHYGHAQDTILLELVPKFSALPVNRVLWTSHEARGVDEFTGKPVALGPATVGKAAVGRTAQKFGDTLHLDAEWEGAGTSAKLVHRAWYQQHPEIGSVPVMYWWAKTSLTPEAFEKLDKASGGKGYFTLSTRKGIEQYLALKDAAVVATGV